MYLLPIVLSAIPQDVLQIGRLDKIVKFHSILAFVPFQSSPLIYLLLSLVLCFFFRIVYSFYFFRQSNNFVEWLIHSPELEKNQRVFKRGKPKSAAPKCAEMSPLTNTKLSNRIKKTFSVYVCTKKPSAIADFIHKHVVERIGSKIAVLKIQSINREGVRNAADGVIVQKKVSIIFVCKYNKSLNSVEKYFLKNTALCKTTLHNGHKKS